MHERVLVHLHDRTSFTDIATKLLCFLNSKATIIDDPDRLNISKILFALCKRIDILCAWPLRYTSFSSKVGFRPS